MLESARQESTYIVLLVCTKRYIFADDIVVCGNSSVGRASASQAEGREFESRLPLLFCGLSIFRMRLKVLLNSVNK